MNELKQNQQHITMLMIERIWKEDFDWFDIGGSGSIYSKELKIAMRALGFGSTKDPDHVIRCR